MVGLKYLFRRFRTSLIHLTGSTVLITHCLDPNFESVERGDRRITEVR